MSLFVLETFRSAVENKLLQNFEPNAGVSKLLLKGDLNAEERKLLLKVIPNAVDKTYC